LLRDPQRLANFYAMCDLFAQPSRTDMLGLVQVEAMLSGTPVVVSDIPGARVVVQETGYGRLSPPQDPASLAEHIIAVLRAPDEYRPERAEVQKLFDTDRALAQYETVLQRIVQKSGHFFAHHRSLPSSNLTTGSNDVHPPTNPLQLRRSFATLTDEDQERLANILRNEADMAYRRRAFLLLDYMELQDSDRVLDCGCGMGFYLMTIGKLRQAQLTGVDDDLGRLHWAQREHVPAGLIRGDINHMSFPDATFDKVLLSEVLEHVPDEGRVLRELYRTLKPGGILAISVPHAHFPFWWDPLNGVWTGLGGEPFRSGPMVGIWTNHERLYTREELVQQVQAAGFEIELVEETTHYSFPFIHYLVYGIGKPLLEQNLLPPTLRKSADRFSGEVNSGSLLNPINLGLTIFRRIDRLNDDPAALEHKHTFVNVLLKARKPAAQPDTVSQSATIEAIPI
jgi:ubiquinone/menaquinone biosynthesis C-methylase UbiE